MVAPYLECRRKFQLSILDDLVLRDTPIPLTLGSAFHYGQEAAFLRAQSIQIEYGDPAGGGPWPPAVLDDLREEALRAARAWPRATPAIVAEAERLLWEYWSGGGGDAPAAARDLQEWWIESVEETCRGPLHTVAGAGAAGASARGAGPRNVLWEARMDLIVTVRAPAGRAWRGGPWIVNWKTARELRGETFSGPRREGQFLSEQIAARAAGRPARGLILAVLTKAARPAFVRDYVMWTDEEITSFARDLITYVSEIRARGRRGPWPMNPISCQGRYRRCDFWDLCADGSLARPLYGDRTDVWENGGRLPAYSLAEDW